jgi:hypothetical protein
LISYGHGLLGLRRSSNVFEFHFGYSLGYSQQRILGIAGRNRCVGSAQIRLQLKRSSLWSAMSANLYGAITAWVGLFRSHVSGQLRYQQETTRGTGWADLYARIGWPECASSWRVGFPAALP